jgi:hypothetical protein
VLGRKVKDIPENFELGELLTDTAMDLETNTTTAFARENSLPFFPTRLRCEDYIYRLWIQQEGIAAAHINAVQTHNKNDSMHNPPASDVLNEEICTLLKRKIKDSLQRVNDLSIKFAYNGEVTSQDTAEILGKITAVHARVIEVAERTPADERRTARQHFAEIFRRHFMVLNPISSNKMLAGLWTTS